MFSHCAVSEYLLTLLLVELFLQSQTSVQRSQTGPQLSVLLTHTLQTLLQHLLFLGQTQHLDDTHTSYKDDIFLCKENSNLSLKCSLIY